LVRVPDDSIEWRIPHECSSRAIGDVEKWPRGPRAVHVCVHFL